MNQQFINNLSEMIFMQRQHHFSNPDVVIYHPGHFPELNIQIAELYSNEGFKQLLIPDVYNRFLDANEYIFHKTLLVELGIPEHIIQPVLGDFTDVSDVVLTAVAQLQDDVQSVLLAGKAFFCRRFTTLATLSESNKIFDVLPLIDDRGIDKDSWYTTEKGRARVLNEFNAINQILNERFLNCEQ